MKLTRLKCAITRILFLFVVAGALSTAHAQTYTLLYQFKAGNDGTSPYSGITLDMKRMALYGTTNVDGSFASGTVFKFNKSGESVLYNFTGTGGDGQNPYDNPLVLDSAGNLYGTTPNGGIYGGNCGSSGCGVVYKIDQSGKETVLYQFKGGSDGDSPYGSLAIDSAGNLYGSTVAGGPFGYGTVFKVDQSGNETILNGFNYGTTDGAVPYGGVVRDNAGNLYGTTSLGGANLDGTVFKITSLGQESILYSFGSYPSDGYLPYSGLTLDSKGNLFGMTSAGGTNGIGTVFKVAQSGAETTLYSFGTQPDANSPFLNELAIDRIGNIFGMTIDGGTFGLGAVFKIDTTGKETVIHSFDGKDGKVPYGGPAIDPIGNVYGTASQGGAYGGGVVFRIKP